MKLSVIIPTLNEEENIGSLLKFLSIDEYHEVIVVDGGSKDETIRIVRTYPTVKLIQTEQGVGKQRNQGARVASGTHLLFLDADVYPTKKFINNFLKEIKSRKLKVACPRFQSSGKKLLGRLLINTTSWFFATFQHKQPNGAGPCMFVSKKVFEKTSGFDENDNFEDSKFIRCAATKGNYGVTKATIKVSDRRFQKEGLIMLVKYPAIGLCVMLNKFDWAQKINYQFNHYQAEGSKSSKKEPITDNA